MFMSSSDYRGVCSISGTRRTQYDQSDPQGHGIEPVPERGAKTPWKTFLAHWDGFLAGT
jgi:hypothetical protein